MTIELSEAIFQHIAKATDRTIDEVKTFYNKVIVNSDIIAIAETLPDPNERVELVGNNIIRQLRKLGKAIQVPVFIPYGISPTKPFGDLPCSIYCIASIEGEPRYTLVWCDSSDTSFLETLYLGYSHTGKIAYIEKLNIGEQGAKTRQYCITPESVMNVIRPEQRINLRNLFFDQLKLSVLPVHKAHTNPSELTKGGKYPNDMSLRAVRGVVYSVIAKNNKLGNPFGSIELHDLNWLESDEHKGEEFDPNAKESIHCWLHPLMTKNLRSSAMIIAIGTVSVDEKGHTTMNVCNYIEETGTIPQGA